MCVLGLEVCMPCTMGGDIETVTALSIGATHGSKEQTCPSGFASITPPGPLNEESHEKLKETQQSLIPELQRRTRNRKDSNS